MTPAAPGKAGQEPGDEACPRPYETHVFIYGRHLADLDQDLLAGFDHVIVNELSFHLLKARHRHRALLYFDMWGKATYRDGAGEYPRHQPAPGNLGEPDVVMNGRTHCYRFDDAHARRFLGWLESYLLEWGDQVAGLFLDDFAIERNWWDASDETKDRVWGPADGRPGWRESPMGWNVERVRVI